MFNEVEGKVFRHVLKKTCLLFEKDDIERYKAGEYKNSGIKSVIFNEEVMLEIIKGTLKPYTEFEVSNIDAIDKEGKVHLIDMKKENNYTTLNLYERIRKRDLIVIGIVIITDYESARIGSDGIFIGDKGIFSNFLQPVLNRYFGSEDDSNLVKIKGNDTKLGRENMVEGNLSLRKNLVQKLNVVINEIEREYLKSGNILELKDYLTKETGKKLLDIDIADNNPYPIKNSKQVELEYKKIKKVIGLLNELVYIIPNQLDIICKENDYILLNNNQVEVVIKEVKDYISEVKRNVRGGFTSLSGLFQIDTETTYKKIAEYIIIRLFLDGLRQVKIK